ncbi:hypothetical protein VM1G_02609 [Cytospora mali]|uniref:Post-GPI attachment to proteins factor 3 n=1 Tax=Cytospora mali TaxID=578113 RepID=A0A194VUN4_CYTMA|nr:hypothetical protein VM1G_02609 [Valsa mali]
MPIGSGRIRPWPLFLALALCLLLFCAGVEASVGDRLPEFGECVKVCKQENCSPGKPQTPIPLLHRLLLWDCPQECDHTCQHIITTQRVTAGEPVVQFHGKWPFKRLLGMQEPLSVLFSAGNLWAHADGLRKVRAAMPRSYTLRPFYVALAYVGMTSWTFSSVFHTRDFRATEELDYFAAGASVLYGLYYTVVHHFRLDRRSPRRRSVLRAWTLLCGVLYLCHVAYLKLWSWDYGYNMAANVFCGLIQNVLWTWYSWVKYGETRRSWAAWPGFAVAWIMLAMSLELFDFAPLWGSVDAHCLWHLGTIGPTVLWYKFLIKDAQDDLTSERLKA